MLTFDKKKIVPTFHTTVEYPAKEMKLPRCKYQLFSIEITRGHKLQKKNRRKQVPQSLSIQSDRSAF